MAFLYICNKKKKQAKTKKQKAKQKAKPNRKTSVSLLHQKFYYMKKTKYIKYKVPFIHGLSPAFIYIYSSKYQFLTSSLSSP